MNKLSLLAFLLLIFLNSNPQSCLPEGIIFSSQAQIDSFQTIYPGCAKIDGNVIISGPDIINLNELNSLDSIGGDLNINSNDVLVDLAGLEGLTFISEDLRIYSNPELLVLTGLDNLNFIGSDIQ